MTTPPIDRILMTADAVGGVWTYALELTAALGSHGIEVVLAVMGPPPRPDQRASATRLENLRLEVGTYALEWMDDPWAEVDASGPWLLALAARHRVDLVHLNTYAHGSLPFEQPVVVVGHSCVASWFEAVFHYRAPARYDEYRRRVAGGLASADAVVAPTAAMSSALERLYGPLGHLRVIPNGRDLGGFRPGRKHPFVLSAGRLWDEAKNVACLAAAASSIAWPVYVAGDLRHPNGKKSRLSGIEALGRLPERELAQWMSRASIYALPARYEPFGLSVLEAAASGCALVLGDIPSLREVWEDAAVYVHPDAPDALTDALRRLIVHDAYRHALSDLARKRAMTMTAARMGLEYVDLYRGLAATRHRPSVSESATGPIGGA